MITRTELKKIAKTRLKDAKILFNNRRYDGSIYLCGYAIELALKAIICKNLDLKGMPSTSTEFDTIVETIKKMKTHNLELLLQLTGTQILGQVKSDPVYFTEWSSIISWDPEMRYAPIGAITQDDSSRMIKSTKKLLKYFLKMA